MTTQLTRLLEPSDHDQAWRALKDALAQLERVTSTSGAGLARWMGISTRTRDRVTLKQLSRPIVVLLLDGTKQIFLDGPRGNTRLVAREGLPPVSCDLPVMTGILRNLCGPRVSLET